MSAKTAVADFERFSTLKIPAKRAAYSDRTAWLMAVMSETAYIQFDPGGPNALLRGLFEKGGFELKGFLFDEETNTQGFVAIRHPSDSAAGLAVVAFRGTKETIDWWTNLDAKMVPVHGRTADSKNEVVGKVHRGFNDAVLSVLPQVEEHLKGHEDLPVYVTGHSLGGALATLATWYLSGEKLVACYTFGAPRVGDSNLGDRYRTPIYRVVNGADPVPFVPPSGATVALIRGVMRAKGKVFSRAFLKRMSGMLGSIEGYRHYGESRYLTICLMQPDETYPELSVEPIIGPIGHVFQLLLQWCDGAWSREDRLDKYHDMSVYRRKLRFWAEKRQNNTI